MGKKGEDGKEKMERNGRGGKGTSRGRQGKGSGDPHFIFLATLHLLTGCILILSVVDPKFWNWGVCMGTCCCVPHFLKLYVEVMHFVQNFHLVITCTQSVGHPTESTHCILTFNK